MKGIKAVIFAGLFGLMMLAGAGVSKAQDPIYDGNGYNTGPFYTMRTIDVKTPCESFTYSKNVPLYYFPTYNFAGNGCTSCGHGYGGYGFDGIGLGGMFN